MSHNYDNGTWIFNPGKCRAPACRCDSPCDDMGGTYSCAGCEMLPDDCQCLRCEDCDLFADDCVCEGAAADDDLRDDDVDEMPAPWPQSPPVWLPPQMRAMNAAMPGCKGCAELSAELAVLRAQRPLDGGK